MVHTMACGLRTPNQVHRCHPNTIGNNVCTWFGLIPSTARVVGSIVEGKKILRVWSVHQETCGGYIDKDRGMKARIKVQKLIKLYSTINKGWRRRWKTAEEWLGQGAITRGSIKAFLPSQSQVQKKLSAKFHVIRHFSCPNAHLPPPLKMAVFQMHPPPIYRQDPSLCMGINKLADVMACPLPWGVP